MNHSLWYLADKMKSIHLIGSGMSNLPPDPPINPKFPSPKPAPSVEKLLRKKKYESPGERRGHSPGSAIA
jgi:hypothetical protein